MTQPRRNQMMSQPGRDQMMSQPWVAPMLLWQRSIQQTMQFQLAFFEQMRQLWTTATPMAAGTFQREVIQLPEAQPTGQSPRQTPAREAAATSARSEKTRAARGPRQAAARS